MNLTLWAQKWNIPFDAMLELQKVFGIVSEGLPPKLAGRSESAVQSAVRLEASRAGCRLWRNNVGALKTETGFIRFGLANDSGAVNDRIKSADLIGIRPVLVTPAHVGHIIGQFVSREVKAGNWRYSGDDREKAQLRWAELIMSLGGDAAFVNSEGSL